MGMKVTADGSVQRDLGIVPIKSQELADQINAALVSSNDPDLRLRLEENSSKKQHQYFYEQQNIRASRKQILPIVQGILDR